MLWKIILTFELIGWISTEARSTDTCTCTWERQYGTTENPKTPHLTSNARKGEIFITNGELYIAQSDGVIGAGLMEPTDGSDFWAPVRRGTPAFPKPTTSGGIQHGDVLYDSRRGTYSVAKRLRDGDTTHQPFDYKREWMTHLREVIGGRRLGDLLLPGTHDSGTSGCDADSYLVDRNELFQLATAFDPQILANWSLTQTEGVGRQLEAGFRVFDLRIADMAEEDGTFRWWHGVTGDRIDEGLDEIARFAERHPGEVLILRFGHFARPGNEESPTLPIPIERKAVIADILTTKLDHRLVQIEDLPNPRNPTVNEILATGRNVIAEVGDSYIRERNDRFCSGLFVTGWSGRTNPEDLFVERSEKLSRWRATYPDRMTALSGCTTPTAKNILAGLIRVYGDDPLVRDIIGLLYPELLDVEPDLMSFEGLYVDLLTMARGGTNTHGMRARPSHLYTFGGSVHYRGVNDMIPYWAARPGLFKLNEIHVDDFLTSTAVDSAILYNRGEIGREVSLSHQGNSKDGYYVWDEDDAQTEGGADGLACDAVLARYRLASMAFPEIDSSWFELDVRTSVTFTEGEFPPDTLLTVAVSSGDGRWFEMYYNNVQVMIDTNLDVYLRGATITASSGRAYLSDRHALFAATCDGLPPSGEIIASVTW